jgi:hypothetical protein
MAVRRYQFDRFSPFNPEIEALLREYPTVSFGMSILNSVSLAETHEAELKR